MKVKLRYALIRLDESEDHVLSTCSKSLKEARHLMNFCRKTDPDGNFLIAKIVEEHSRPRRWRLS